MGSSGINAVPKGVAFDRLHFDKTFSYDPSGPDGDHPDGTHHYEWTDVGVKVCELEFRNAWLAHGYRTGHDKSKEKYIDQASQVVTKAHANAFNKLEADVTVSGPSNVAKVGVNAELTLHI